MKVTLGDSYSISDITEGDKAAYVEHLQEKQIYDNILAIPYPYTAADADWWLANGNLKRNWAIRRSDGFLIGCVGFQDPEPFGLHRAELGYWLAKPYWSKGIMTDAVKAITEYGFKELGLVRITANVFHFNVGSGKVLVKAGFQLEGVLRNHYVKGGKIFDGILYAKIKE
ncbi:MAG: GNAT family N-acetyltransferase [Xanthomonadaceae bacterium]|nr:GNAT family N-acetyltransferase [Xanthomonadaceae bacterium]